MTPYDLEEAKRRAEQEVGYNQGQIINVIFSMLSTLLQHEADKEVERRNAARK